MKDIGYIKLHRKILDNPITCKDSDYFSVWIYLLLNATHKNITAIFRSEKITLLPGQLITGRIAIANKLKISESKVRRILKDLENDQQISRQTSNKNSLVTILNWQQYQKNDQQNITQMTNNRPTSDQQVTTNNKVNNDNNIIFNLLLNKYKQNFPTSFREKTKIITEIQNSDDYIKLTEQEQNDLFYKMMSLRRSDL